MASVPSGLSEAIKRSFAAVFDDLNLSVEAWFQETKLLTVGRDNYVRFMTEVVGRFALFGVNRSVSVDDSYVTVAVSRDLERLRYRPRQTIETELLSVRERAKLLFDQHLGVTPAQAISASKGVFALIGNAGSGKTTAFRYLAMRTARGEPLRGEPRIAVFLAVRDMAARNLGVRDALNSFFDNLAIEQASRVVARLLRSGKIALFLDGLDETRDEHQQQLVDDIRSLIGRYPRSVFCISARPYTLVLGRATFATWETLRLRFPERLSFVRKWFDEVDPDKGKRLLESCRDTPAVLDLGSSPLLLSIVCALYYNDLDIPVDQDELYSRAVEGLLGGWDAFRNVARATPLRTLTVRRRVVLMTWLAAATFELKRLVFSATDVERSGVVTRLRDVLHVDLPDATELLKCLFNDFGILVERAPGLYAFAHLTLHEYLTALYVVDTRTERILVHTHAREHEWFNVIRMVAKMLPKASNYLAELADVVDLADRYQVLLLKAAWEADPVCSTAELKYLAQCVYDRALSLIARVSERCERQFEKLQVIVLPVTSTTDGKRDPHLVAQVLATSLSDVFTLLVTRGIRFSELVAPTRTHTHLWDMLGQDGISLVEVRVSQAGRDKKLSSELTTG